MSLGENLCIVPHLKALIRGKNCGVGRGVTVSESGDVLNFAEPGIF